MLLVLATSAAAFTTTVPVRAPFCARLPDALLRELTTQCLTLEAAEADAPVTWLALRLCWNAAYRDQAMQQRLVRQVGARTLTALLEQSTRPSTYTCSRTSACARVVSSARSSG